MGIVSAFPPSVVMRPVTTRPSAAALAPARNLLVAVEAQQRQQCSTALRARPVTPIACAVATTMLTSAA
eukprot:1642701-Prymnesium_polylepis.4